MSRHVTSPLQIDSSLHLLVVSHFITSCFHYLLRDSILSFRGLRSDCGPRFDMPGPGQSRSPPVLLRFRCRRMSPVQLQRMRREPEQIPDQNYVRETMQRSVGLHGVDLFTYGVPPMFIDYSTVSRDKIGPSRSISPILNV